MEIKSQSGYSYSGALSNNANQLQFQDTLLSDLPKLWDIA